MTKSTRGEAVVVRRTYIPSKFLAGSYTDKLHVHWFLTDSISQKSSIPSFWRGILDHTTPPSPHHPPLANSSDTHIYLLTASGHLITESDYPPSLLTESNYPPPLITGSDYLFTCSPGSDYPPHMLTWSDFLSHQLTGWDEDHYRACNKKKQDEKSCCPLN